MKYPVFVMQGGFPGGQVPQMPQSPAGFNPNQPGQMPQTANMASGFESEGSWSKSVKRSRKTKAVTGRIKMSRKELVDYLKQNGVDLLTSATEFQKNGDFIKSSYVIYREYNDYKEPFENFLEKYPDLRATAEFVRDEVSGLQNELQVKTNFDDEYAFLDQSQNSQQFAQMPQNQYPQQQVPNSQYPQQQFAQNPQQYGHQQVKPQQGVQWQNQSPQIQQNPTNYQQPFVDQNQPPQQQNYPNPLHQDQNNLQSQ